MYAITSQTQEEAEKAVKEWNLQYTTMIGDPENVLVKYLQKMYLPKLVISFDERQEEYPNGMVQPGELVFIKDKPIVAWYKNPNKRNANGAMGRPSAHKMWRYIEGCIEQQQEDSSGSTVKQLECSDGKEFCSMGHLGYSIARYMTGK